MDGSINDAIKDVKDKLEKKVKPVRYAMYKRCSVCKLIMTDKVKKLHHVKDGIYVHKLCYAKIARKAERDMAKANEVINRARRKAEAESRRREREEARAPGDTGGYVLRTDEPEADREAGSVYGDAEDRGQDLSPDDTGLQRD